MGMLAVHCSQNTAKCHYEEHPTKELNVQTPKNKIGEAKPRKTFRVGSLINHNNLEVKRHGRAAVAFIRIN